jgi:hypothetical protein
LTTASKSLLDPTFVYRNAANTDVRLTFERVRREQALRERSAKVVIGIVAKPAADATARNARPVNALDRVAKVTW